MRFNPGFLFIPLTIVLTVYGQMVMKWQMDRAGPLPSGFAAALPFLLRQLLNPWILSCFAAAFLASLSWMATMTRFELSFAYPFMSLSLVLVGILSVMLLGEPITWTRACGTLMILGGLILITR